MADTEKRLFIGGLHHALKEQDLRERFGRHGAISSLEMKTKKDTKGNPIKTFAHMDITITDNELKKCMSIYNNTKWNGNTMQIQIAKESFLTRLEQERTCKRLSDKEEPVVVRPKKPAHQAAAEKRLEENFEKAGVSEFIVKGKVPGTQIEGEKNWVVGKYGRVLPVVYIRRKDKQKIVCYDPSKFSHHVKKFKADDKVDEGIGMPKVEQLTWDLPESHSEVSMKRKGIFTQSRSLMAKRKRVKDDHVVKRDQQKLPVIGMPEKRGNIHGSGQSDRDFDDDEGNGCIPTNNGQVQVIADGVGQPTDFEIVRDCASLLLPKANSNTSMFESEPGYDSDDRESVDTDELCTLVRSSSKNSAGSQTNRGLRKKEGQKAASTTGDEQAASAMMKSVKQAHSEREESDMCKQGDLREINDGSRNQDDSAELDRKLDTDTGDDDGWSSDSKEHTSLEEDAMGVTKLDKNYPDGDDGSIPSVNFEPLILDRTHLQGRKEGNDLAVNQDDDEEEEEEDEEEHDNDDGDDHHEHESGERESATQDSGEEDDDQETLGSPIARFDFEPFILDRAAISKSLGTETSGDLPEVGCHATEKKEVLDDSETDEDNENDESTGTDKHSDEDTGDESEELIGEDDNTEVKAHDNALDNKKEMSSSTEEEGKETEKKSHNSLKATPKDVKKSLAGSELKSDTIQQKYDKNGRLLSKAASKRLAREEVEKQKQANERRLESMKQQQRALIDRHVAIKGALSALDDKDKKQGKHITFDSDEEQDSEIETVAGKDETTFAGQKIKGNISLFKSDSDSDDDEDLKTDDRVGKMWGDDDDEDDDDDAERFRIKPQYEGEAGQKLIRMEARYGGDARFKLDTRFLDKEGDSAETGDKTEVTEDAQDDPFSDLQEEKRRSLAILQNMLGTPVVASSKPVEPNFKDPSQLHYDPSRDEHRKYELQGDNEEDESDAKMVEQEIRKEKRKMEEERAKIPEVSKEKFFQVSSNLKDAFSGGGGGGGGGGGVKENDDEDQDAGGAGTFTFFGGDDSNDEEPQSKMTENTTASDLASSLFPSKRFKYDSSDDEDGQDGEEMQVDAKKNKVPENAAEEESEDTSVPQAFFFQTDDPRLGAGSQKFCRPKDQDAMMTTWEEMKAQLQNDFRKRHQKAVQDQKTSKKWLKKPVKSKTKK